MKKRVLICIGDAAGGHISAANAIKTEFARQFDDEFEVTVIDLYTAADIGPFNSSADLYLRINRSRILEFAYNCVLRVLNTPVIYPLYRSFLLFRMKAATEKIIKKYNPDIIISNNAVITALFEQLKKEGAPWKSAVLVTDIAYIFRGWADRHADLVISPTQEVTQRLLHYGVPAGHIVKDLFPINANLRQFRSREQVLENLGLKITGVTTVLITSGGFGLISVEKAIETLVCCEEVQLIVLTGRLEEFRERLESRFASCPRAKFLGFVDTIQDYYNTADIIVGKPGPATIMEIELFNKKAILTRPVGFQEQGNTEYALRNPNFTSIGKKWHLLPKYVKRLINQDYIPFAGRRQFDEAATIVEQIAGLCSRS